MATDFILLYCTTLALHGASVWYYRSFLFGVQGTVVPDDCGNNGLTGMTQRVERALEDKLAMSLPAIVSAPTARQHQIASILSWRKINNTEIRNTVLVSQFLVLQYKHGESANLCSNNNAVTIQFQTWRWRQYTSPKLWYLLTSSHRVTNQKTNRHSNKRCLSSKLSYCGKLWDSKEMKMLTQWEINLLT